jgi:hypothetical protein
LKNKFKLSLVFSFIVVFSLQSQTYNHTTIWSRLAFQKKINNWNFRVEFDYRQQNDFQKSMLNPFQKPLTRWVRLNSTYSKGNFSHSFILPNIIKSSPLVGKKSDLSRPDNIEWRFTFFEEYNLPYKKFETSLRLGLEYRSITTDQVNRRVNRYRIRLNEAYNVNKNTRLNISYEPSYSFGSGEDIRFNSSQLAFRVNQNIGKKISLSTGLNHIYRKRSNLIEFDNENAFLFYLTYNI